MEGKWTRGPWRAEYDNDTGPGDEGFWEFYAILDASGHGIGRFDDEKDANLAAQAPAMAEALEDAQKRLRGAGMLGGADDPVNVVLTAIKGE